MSELKRSLDARLLNMIAIGGSIGTGIFLASGSALHSAGPFGVLAAYLLMGLMVYFLMTGLGEMAAYMPSSGSFYLYAAKFVDPALGYALGWNYWYNWAITVASEISAATLIVSYWVPADYQMLFSILFLGLFFSLNALSARGFGEAEYWFSLIKVITIIAFIILGVLMLVGWIAYPDGGLKNWMLQDTNSISIAGILPALIIAGFSFQGTELIGIAAGESVNPGKTIPTAIRQVFWRILLFFVCSILVMSLLVPYTSSFLSLNTVEASPFTMVFSQAGMKHAAHFVNFIILIAVLSAGNSGLYASTRMLWYLSKEKHAPQAFSRLNRKGVPIYALCLTASISFLTFLSSIYGHGQIYFWLLSASSLSGFIAWLGIAVSHYRFRKAYLAQGKKLDQLPYVAKGYPFAPILAMIMCISVIVLQGYLIINDAKDGLWYGLLASYIGVPIFLLVWAGYKWAHRTKWVDVRTCDFGFVKQLD